MSTSPPHVVTPRPDPLGPAAPGRELRVLAAVSDLTAGRPGVVRGARGLSHLGEHALGWIAAGTLGAALDARRRPLWGQAVLGAVGAHGVSIAVKRVVRRRRPDHPAVAVRVGTPSRLSFPSSHATSTTAAAALLGDALGAPPGLLPAVLVPPMLASRLVLGVHYPTDVLAGAGLGWGAATAVRAARRRGLLGGDPR
ncbi:phosphatase PAP2 family protein [Rhodococcus aerolatus]